MNDIFRIKKFILGPLHTNCYLVYDRKSLRSTLIDPGVYSREIDDYIKEHNIHVEFILNTHGHADHVSGDSAYNLPVFIHEFDNILLQNPNRILSFLADENVKPISVKKFLKDGDKIKLGNIDLEIIHTPGHTPGSISVKCGDVLFSGDTLFFEGIGRTDLPEGNHEALLKSIREKLLVLPDSVRIYPGHGPETTIEHEKKNNPFI